MLPTLDDVIAAQTAKSDSALHKRLLAVSHDVRQILWVFAVVYEPINQTTVQKILSKLGWESNSGTRLSSMMDRALKERLIKQALLQVRSARLVCNPVIVEILAREAQQNDVFKEIALVAEMVEPKKARHPRRRYAHYQSPITTTELRHLREALYAGGEIDNIREYSSELFAICFSPFDPEWFATLPDALKGVIISFGIEGQIHAQHELIIYSYLEQQWRSRALHSAELRGYLAQYLLEQGQFDGIEALLPDDLSWRTLSSRAMLFALQGEYGASLPLFETALKALRKATKKRTEVLPDFSGICFLLALLQSKDPAHRALLKTITKSGGRGYSFDGREEVYMVISDLAQVLAGEVQKEQAMGLDQENYFSNEHAQLLGCLAWHWLGESPTRAMLTELAENVLEQGTAKPWYVYQSLSLLKHYQYKGRERTAINNLAARQIKSHDFQLILSLIEPQKAWERALNALDLLEPNRTQNSQTDTGNQRLIWVLDLDYTPETITPKEQKRNKSGTWSKGRNVSLKRLHQSPEELTYLSEADKRICQCIVNSFGYRGYTEYSLPIDNAIHAAINHPHIYWEGRYDRAIEINCTEPELIVKAQNTQLLIQLHPGPADEESCNQILKESEYRVNVVQFSPQHLHIARILGADGLRVPIEAKERALQSINTIAPLLAIQSDIGGGNIDAEQKKSDSHLYMQIEAQKTGLRFELSVRPLGPDGPHLRPGEGRQIMMAEVNGARLQTERNLALEEQNYNALAEQCNLLQTDVWEELPCEWGYDEEQSLELLFQLQGYCQAHSEYAQNTNQDATHDKPQNNTQRTAQLDQSDGQHLELLWPKGGQIKFSKEAGLANMQASVQHAGDWFELQGQLALDDGEVLAMGDLMALMQDSNSRFIKLSDDTFVSLTQQLRQRLDAIHKHGEKQRYHALALGALDELTQGMDVQGDATWTAQKERIQEAYSQAHTVPVTLQAELRDYQEEGFTWLARLAHWGAGACLADDMGLGKTIQSLALILKHAALGPTLILAPTSVCINWINEAKQFAPTLKPQRFGDSDRNIILDKAGPFDLIVCSYGLLQTEQSRLQAVQWQCIVADEAQALKNPNTKRAKAAMRLQASFKMVTTGTPIENHLGELWSLFRFINPGLLGSQDSFNSRFANPIQNQQDKTARLHLKRLVQPFILRRLKTEVLPELPARTEITIRVPQSKDEQIFYETLRRKALKNLSENKGSGGQQQLKVLTEIMRLRRACCHPKLALKSSPIASSKLEAFGNILSELLENKHRTLVFSQFVDHLSLIRDYLDKRDIHYQYLDGSTTIKKREKSVNAFQNGEGDVFLISLKAGGSGLNLTAADYVVHMDPWWNPAVEDQASDRAHRLGQTRPVTIYRLVVENTIEEKIIAMHGQKRDLADSLLDGSDMSGKLNVEEIMALIAEG